MTERQLLLASLVSFASAVSVTATERFVTNPYRGIVLRNAFGLATNKTEAVLPPPAPLPDVQLLGITTILGDKRAIIRVRWPTKAGQAAREETFVLRNYQSTREIEVMEIDEGAATVCVKISGTIKTLCFESDPGASPGSLPAPPQPPG